MAINVETDQWIPSFSADATNITIPLASLDITQNDANDDVRVFMKKLADVIYDAYEALETADRPDAFRPTRSPSINGTTLKLAFTYGLRYEDVESDGFTLPPADPNAE